LKPSLKIFQNVTTIFWIKKIFLSKCIFISIVCAKILCVTWALTSKSNMIGSWYRLKTVYVQLSETCWTWLQKKCTSTRARRDQSKAAPTRTWASPRNSTSIRGFLSTRCQFHQRYRWCFSYKRSFGSFFYVHVTREMLLKQRKTCVYNVDEIDGSLTRAKVRKPNADWNLHKVKAE